MCLTLMNESKNLLKNLASKFTQKLAQDIVSKTRKEKCEIQQNSKYRKGLE